MIYDAIIFFLKTNIYDEILLVNLFISKITNTGIKNLTNERPQEVQQGSGAAV